MDEKSIDNGHQYLTVVLNAETGEVLHLAEGKRKTSLQGFFAKLTKEQKASIKAVGIDRAWVYKAVVEPACTNGRQGGAPPCQDRLRQVPPHCQLQRGDRHDQISRMACCWGAGQNLHQGAALQPVSEPGEPLPSGIHTCNYSMG